MTPPWQRSHTPAPSRYRLPRTKSSANLAATWNSPALSPPTPYNRSFQANPSRSTTKPTTAAVDAISQRLSGSWVHLDHFDPHSPPDTTASSATFISESSPASSPSSTGTSPWLGITWSVPDDQRGEAAPNVSFITLPTLVHPCQPSAPAPAKKPQFYLVPPDDLFDIALEDDLLLVPPSSASPYWEVLNVADAPAVEAATADRYEVEQSATTLARGSKFVVAGLTASEASVSEMEAKLADALCQSGSLYTSKYWPGTLH